MDSATGFSARIERLAEQARADRADFEPPASPPAPEQAMTYLREGFGPAVMVYVDGRTGDDGLARFDEDEFAQLQRAMNTWLELYARCYGEELDLSLTIRKAAEALIETHNVKDTAAILTGVPERHRGR
jgi:hypothetical protein